MNAPDIFSAALAGLLSFLSPCVLPLVPAYLSFISGSSAQQLSSGQSRGKIFLRSLAFSGGFTLAFTLMGVIFSGGAMFMGRSMAAHYIGIAGGIIVIILGINLIFDFIKLLDTDARLIGKFTGRKASGMAGSMALGLAFAAGWSPCIGPILASILLFAGREGNIAKASALLVAYSAGFALPFIASGLFFDSLRPLMRFFTRHGKSVRIVSGLVLVAFGIAMALGSLGSVSAVASRVGYNLQDFTVLKPGLSTLLASGFWLAVLVLVAAPSLPPLRRRLSKPRIAALAVVAGALALEVITDFSTIELLAGWLTFAGI
jgi:cytochrome c-type biogenesis protein